MSTNKEIILSAIDRLSDQVTELEAENERLRAAIQRLGFDPNKADEIANRRPKVSYSEYDIMTNTQPYAEDLGLGDEIVEGE